MTPMRHPYLHSARTLLFFLGLIAVILSACRHPTTVASKSVRWWKGNLHTHTLWSDGDHYPEVIAEWYKTNGYHFLTLSDHNIVQEGEKWIPATKNKGGSQALEAYLNRFGPDWVERRVEEDGQESVRLKTLDEFGPLLAESGRFLLLRGEEISDRHLTLPLHLNAHNITERITPQGGSNVVDVLQRNVDAVLEQRARTGQFMVPHINHPNFGYAIRAEELMQIRGERFFEVYNGHPAVHNEGDAYRVGLDRMWDIALAFRLTELNLGPLFGLAVDDAHNYHAMATNLSNPGRGWIMVQAPELTPESILGAMEAGDFYATSGVRLRAIHEDSTQLSLDIDGESGVTYRTRFIGTRRGFDRASEPAPRPPGGSFPVTARYSQEIGEVFQESEGLQPRYVFRGDEIYVRAKVISSKPKENPYAPGETETAWVQPVIDIKDSGLTAIK